MVDSGNTECVCTYHLDPARLGRELRATAGGQWNHSRSANPHPHTNEQAAANGDGGGGWVVAQSPQSPSRKKAKRGQQPLTQVHRGNKIRTLAL